MSSVEDIENLWVGENFPNFFAFFSLSIQKKSIAVKIYFFPPPGKSGARKLMQFERKTTKKN
jgi:hypothetical protein